MSKITVEGSTNKINTSTAYNTNSEKPFDLEKKPKAKEPTVQYYVKFSFILTYILLLTTATVTFIEAIRTPFPKVRHILNLETAISVIAGYFYSIFTIKIEEFSAKNIPIDWAELSRTRYIDWAITTPLMLIALCLVLSQNINTSVKLSVILPIVLLNYLMLYIGYIGESGKINKLFAMIGGFLPFIGMFYIIYLAYVKSSSNASSTILYLLYLTIWGLYGIVYMFGEEYKNISMNILDLTAKCLIGLGLWAYYTKIIVI